MREPTSNITARCPYCTEPIDYCRGHGELGDPEGAAVLAEHDEGRHFGCDPRGCEEAEVPHVLIITYEYDLTNDSDLEHPDVVDQQWWVYDHEDPYSESHWRHATEEGFSAPHVFQAAGVLNREGLIGYSTGARWESGGWYHTGNSVFDDGGNVHDTVALVRGFHPHEEAELYEAVVGFSVIGHAQRALSEKS